MTAADIYLLGSGIYSFLNMTVYTQHLLYSVCKEVFYLHDLPSLEKYLSKINPNCTNLMPIYYKDGRIRADIYRDIVQHVISARMEKKDEDWPVALLLHGHPLVYSSISQILIQECRLRNFALEIHPGISSLDTMFVDLNLDISTHGIQVLLAHTAIQRNIQINPSIGLILYQIKSPLSLVADRLAPSVPEDALELKKYLLKFYSPTHIAKVVESAVEIGFQSRITEITLGRLEEAYSSFNYNSSLYIPVSFRGHDT